MAICTTGSVSRQWKTSVAHPHLFPPQLLFCDTHSPSPRALIQMAGCESQRVVLDGFKRDMDKRVSEFESLLAAMAEDAALANEMTRRLASTEFHTAMSASSASTADAASADADAAADANPAQREMLDLQRRIAANANQLAASGDASAALRRQAAELQAEIQTIDSKLPALEAEKKAVVAAKNYKVRF
jgi:hypothetical protein